MEGVYCLVTALTNTAAYVPYMCAHNNNRRMDGILVMTASIFSFLFHISPIFFPFYSTELLWMDRVAAVVTAVHFLYHFAAVCPHDMHRAFAHTYVVTGIGLLCLFLSDVILAMRPSFMWCILHSMWHICAFLTVRKLQFFIYRAQQK